MSLLPDDFWKRAEAAVRALDAQPELATAVQAEVDGFFAKHPKLHRTKLAEAFIASLFIEQLSADSQSAASNQTKKVA